VRKIHTRVKRQICVICLSQMYCQKRQRREFSSPVRNVLLGACLVAIYQPATTFTSTYYRWSSTSISLTRLLTFYLMMGSGKKIMLIVFSENVITIKKLFTWSWVYSFQSGDYFSTKFPLLLRHVKTLMPIPWNSLLKRRSSRTLCINSSSLAKQRHRGSSFRQPRRWKTEGAKWRV
jgi:hypothetical protein